MFVPDEINKEWKPATNTRRPRYSAELTVHCQRKVALRNTFHSLLLLNEEWFPWFAIPPDDPNEIPPYSQFGLTNGNVIVSPLGELLFIFFQPIN